MVFAALSLLTGIALLGLAGWLALRSRQCRHWPSVTGVVIESRVDDAHLEMTKPVLRYRYQVGGQSHVGFRVAFAGYGISRRAMVRLIQPYPQGSTVTVYYNPRDPASAVLDNTARADAGYWFAFGLGFLALAAYLAWR